MVHPYYTISQEGLSDNDSIKIQVNFTGSKEFVLQNQKQIIKYLKALTLFTEENLVEDIETFLNANTDIDFSIEFEVNSNGFIDNKKKIEDIAIDYKDISSLSFHHDITGLSENQVVNLSYLRSISLNSGYIVQFHFQYGSKFKEDLIRAIRRAVKILCKEFYENSDEISEEIIENFDEEEITFEDDKYYSTIYFDINESLGEYLKGIEFYEELIEKLNEVAESYDTDFAYQVNCCNAESVGDIFIY